MRTSIWLAGLALVISTATGVVAQEGLLVSEVTGPIDVMASKLRPTGLTLTEKAGLGLSTRLRLGYTDSHLQISFECEDTRLTSSIPDDGIDLTGEDVLLIRVQVPDHNRLLVMEVSPIGQKTISWQTEDGSSTFLGAADLDRNTVGSAVFGVGAFGTPATPNQQNIEGWAMAINIPFDFLGVSKPAPGTEWQANFGRMDWDSGKADIWTWQEEPATIVFD
jgi:hypothetical protein